MILNIIKPKLHNPYDYLQSVFTIIIIKCNFYICTKMLTEAEVEQMRLKFRKEAMDACTLAESRGFTAGVESCSSSIRFVKRF